MLGILRSRPEFRKLWFAQVASSGGDWFSRVAVLSLIAQLSGPDAALGVGALYGVELALRLLPTTLLGPIAGPIADRFPRKLLMIGADVVRAALVLSLLFVRDAADLGFLYVVVALQMGTGIFFDSARSGVLPSTVERSELHAAYALTSATWSMMLAVGSLCGGVLVSFIGVRGVFVVDAATYLVSAALVARIRVPPVPEQTEPLRWSEIFLFTDLRRGLEHVRALGLTSTVLAKTFWGPAGGFLVMLSIAANKRFGSETDPEVAALAIGIFYSARGVGTGFGPVLARRLFGSTDRRLRVQIALGYVVGALGYALFPFAGSVPVAALCIFVAHLGGSTIWVGSTTLWQKHVEDAFRGRVFALEFLGMTFSFALGGVLTGLLYDRTQSVDQTTWAVCTAVLVMGAAWTAMTRSGRKPVAREAEG
jgi:MFS family permease